MKVIEYFDESKQNSSSKDAEWYKNSRLKGEAIDPCAHKVKHLP